VGSAGVGGGRAVAGVVGTTPASPGPVDPLRPLRPLHQQGRSGPPHQQGQLGRLTRSTRPSGVTGTTLDAGALIALEAGSPYMRELVRLAFAERGPLAVPAGVLAQVWRASARQARLARLLGSTLVEVVPLDRSAAVAVGKLCAETGAVDVVDVSVVLCARQRGHPVVTSDPRDLRKIGPELQLLDPVTGR